MRALMEGPWRVRVTVSFFIHAGYHWRSLTLSLYKLSGFMREFRSLKKKKSLGQDSVSN